MTTARHSSVLLPATPLSRMAFHSRPEALRPRLAAGLPLRCVTSRPRSVVENKLPTAAGNRRVAVANQRLAHIRASRTETRCRLWLACAAEQRRHAVMRQNMGDDWCAIFRETTGSAPSPSVWNSGSQRSSRDAGAAAHATHRLPPPPRRAASRHDYIPGLDGARRNVSAVTAEGTMQSHHRDHDPQPDHCQPK
jgi:hypothetical protein